MVSLTARWGQQCKSGPFEAFHISIISYHYLNSVRRLVNCPERRERRMRKKSIRFELITSCFKAAKHKLNEINHVIKKTYRSKAKFKLFIRRLSRAFAATRRFLSISGAGATTATVSAASSVVELFLCSRNCFVRFSCCSLNCCANLFTLRWCCGIFTGAADDSVSDLTTTGYGFIWTSNLYELGV